MIRKAKTIIWLSLVLHGNAARTQETPPTILEVDIENLVEYQEDLSDPAKFTTNPNITPPGPIRKGGVAIVLGDIVAVNGQPVKGTLAGRAGGILNPRPNATPGQGIADITRTTIREQIYEILQSDGTPIGTIVGLGLSGGIAPPGSPASQTGGNWAIVGGTGLFLGARGQFGGGQTVVPARAASLAEDPVNRRINGGGTMRFVLTVIPMSRPQIVTTASGPVVTHSSDFTPVTASKPASAGEILSLFASGLGPTNPGPDPGKPFAAVPPAVVNTPVKVSVNGKTAEVTGAAGLPGEVDRYQVNFRVPDDTVKGTATIQVSAAWIAGDPVNINVQ